jgi:hypothetical protein
MKLPPDIANAIDRSDSILLERPPARRTTDAERKRKRADDAARCRSREARGAKLLKLEVEAVDIGLCVRFGLLNPDQIDDAEAISAAISALLSKALTVLLNAKRKV